MALACVRLRVNDKLNGAEQVAQQTGNSLSVLFAAHGLIFELPGFGYRGNVSTEIDQ